MMTTRFRALSLASVATAVFFLSLLGVIPVADWVGAQTALTINLWVAVVSSVVLVVGTPWVLFFKSKNWSLAVLSFFPGVALFPYVLLADSVIKSVFSDLGQISAAAVAAAIYWLVAYLLILTVNVLNGSLLFGIPLGQAGKAAQFVFSLISSYFLIAFLFGGELGLEVRLLMSALFIFYYSFACVFVLQVTFKEVWMSSLAITLVMMIAIVALSLWPLSSVYATLAAVVMFYIMLNVAVEVREKIGQAIWVEYAVLLALIIIILFTNGVWGINGRLI
ncbi:MAG: hypothetical protein JNK26_01405 [Candidatus Doudnabacteria bacterium]|nr:hypothetical protein [Candidatus Doudnabacteria bacterium]